jgi:hypothetical protein
MRFNHLFLFVVSLCTVFSTSLIAQTSIYEGPLRGEMAAPPTNNLDLEASLETVKLDIIITEIEDAGYSMDVVEGFDEEWEEDIWVASDADEMESLVFLSDDSDLMENDELISSDELLEEWEDPTWVDPELAMEEIGDDFDEEEADEWEMDDMLEVDISSDLSEFALLEDNGDEWQEVDEWWIAEDNYDESWDDLQEEWEMDALDDAYESEDIEYMEMMYGMD